MNYQKANLNSQQMEWVENTLESLTIEEMIGQLLCPEWVSETPEKWEAILKKIPVGGMFFPDTSEPEYIESIANKFKVPPFICADIERGFTHGTCFAPAMGCTASGHTNVMKKRGDITAREVRANGVNWAFSPNVDIPFNHRNLETLTRAWSDEPDKIIEMVLPLIEGMQHQGLLAATAKHFPGTGLDDRDQHFCTVINSFSKAKWDKTFGKVWRAVIDAGVMSIMPGHISFPAYEGLEDQPASAMPATLNPRILQDLLRKELGFEGVIVSDAGVMIGFSSRVAKSKMALKYIQAGGDVYLFPNTVNDFESLLIACNNGEISIDRIKDSVRRILIMKAKLNLNEMFKSSAITQIESKEFQSIAKYMTEDSITVQRNDGAIPAKSLTAESKVLTVTIAPTTGRGKTCLFEAIDEELKQRGMNVTNVNNPGHEFLLDVVDSYDMIFINIEMKMHQTIGCSRIIDSFGMNFWKAFWYGKRNVIFTSFGSPYHLYEFPHLPNMVLTYDPLPMAQRAVVKVWLGESPAQGNCPITMPLEAGLCL